MFSQAFDRVLGYLDALLGPVQNPTAVHVKEIRYYLLTKLQEEMGEYAEMLNARYNLSKRKWTKLANEIGDEPTTSDILAEADRRRKLEAGDMLWIAMAIAVLEGYDIQGIVNYFETEKTDGSTEQSDNIR